MKMSMGQAQIESSARMDETKYAMKELARAHAKRA